MLSFFINYIILSCLFNLSYYFFDGENWIDDYISTTQNKMISDLKENNLNTRLLQELLRSQSIYTQANKSDTPAFLKMMIDLIFFPLNLLVIGIIIIDKLSEKIMN